MLGQTQSSDRAPVRCHGNSGQRRRNHRFTAHPAWRHTRWAWSQRQPWRHYCCRYHNALKRGQLY